MSILRHFSVGLLPSDDLRYSIEYESNQSLDAHERVLRPLVQNAREIFVYGLKGDSPLLIRHEEILIKHRGKHALNIDEEG